MIVQLIIAVWIGGILGFILGAVWAGRSTGSAGKHMPPERGVY